MVSPGGLVTRMLENPEPEVLLLRTTSTQEYILNSPYVDVPSVNTSSRGTSAWRRSIIHTAATQRERYCTSKHTRERSPGTANCIKLHMQLPSQHRIKAKPHTSLNGTFFFLVVFICPPVCVLSRGQCAKKRGTGEERRGGWGSSCARSLRESVRRLVRFLTWTEGKIKSQRSSPSDGFMSESLRDFSPLLRTQIPGPSCLAPATLQNWTARPADQACCHQFERDVLPV